MANEGVAVKRHPAKIAWRDRNRDRMLEYSRRWRERNPGAHTRWRMWNRERFNELRRAYYHRNKFVIKFARVYGVSMSEARQLISETGPSTEQRT